MRKLSSWVLVATVAVVLAVPGSDARASGADARKQADAAVDRNILLPSAETISAGQLTFNDYEIFLVGLTYGITDDLQVSATTLLPIVSDIPFVALVSAKYRLIAMDNMLLSIQPTLNLAHSSGETGGTFGFQLLYDYIVDDAGDLTLSAGLSANWLFVAGTFDEVSDGAGLLLGGAVTWRVAEIVKLMGELVLPGAIGGGEFELVEQALLFNYGVRFFGERIAVDLTFLRPIHPDVDVGPLLMGIPYLTFSARF